MLRQNLHTPSSPFIPFREGDIVGGAEGGVAKDRKLPDMNLCPQLLLAQPGRLRYRMNFLYIK